MLVIPVVSPERLAGLAIPGAMCPPRQSLPFPSTGFAGIKVVAALGIDLSQTALTQSDALEDVLVAEVLLAC